MVILKGSKAPDTMVGRPNENFTDDPENYYVVDDNSELGQLILENAPFIDLLIENDEVVDAIPIDPPPAPIPQPTQEDYLLELDFRVSMVELGLV